jgi:hypothetical protein
MKKTLINTLATSVLIASLGFATTNAFAVTDFSQLELRKHVVEAQQKLKEATAATGAQQQTLLGEHMQKLQDCLEMCQKMKPRADLSESERSKWYAEQQKTMNQIMDQMMEEHKLTMASAPCEVNKK